MSHESMTFALYKKNTGRNISLHIGSSLIRDAAVMLLENGEDFTNKKAITLFETTSNVKIASQKNHIAAFKILTQDIFDLYLVGRSDFFIKAGNSLIFLAYVSLDFKSSSDEIEWATSLVNNGKALLTYGNKITSHKDEPTKHEIMSAKSAMQFLAGKWQYI